MYLVLVWGAAGKISFEKRKRVPLGQLFPDLAAVGNSACALVQVCRGSQNRVELQSFVGAAIAVFRSPVSLLD